MHCWKSAAPLLATLICLTACGPYSITVNDNELYSPPTLFTNFKMKDGQLRDCLDQTIKDKAITQPNQLKRLACTHAGIQSLKGIEVFSQLEALNLNDNQLTGITPLARLGQLKQVLLKGNRLKDAAALLNLLKLESLDIRDNPHLSCDDLNQLRTISSAQLSLPVQCEES